MQLVYDQNLPTLLDLIPIDTDSKYNIDGTHRIKKMHQQFSKIINKKNLQKTKQASKNQIPSLFNEGDLLCIHLRPECFPRGLFAKLKHKVDDSFQIIKSIEKIYVKSNYL